MIQRIQSVYLSGVAIIGVVLFLVPFGTISAFTLTATELSSSKEVLKQTYPLAIVIGFGLLVALAGIFTFKNRKLQIKLCTLSMINQAAILALAMFLYLDGTATELGDEKPTYAIGIYLPVIGMVLSFLASKAIRKDEDLVKSVDRLR